MPYISPHSPVWDTSCSGWPAKLSALEGSELGEHLAYCGALRGPLHQFFTGAALLWSLVAEHVITTALLVTLLVGALSLVH